MHSAAHDDNLIRWTDKKKGFYESHFIKVNLPDENAAFWWKFTILKPLKGPVQFDVWGIFFDALDPSRSVALKESFTSEDTAIERDRLYCRYGSNELEHGGTRGALSGAINMNWDVRWDVNETGFRHFPKPWMYTAPIPKTKALSPVLSSQFYGSVTVGKRTFHLNGHKGMQGHNWGSQHAHSWVWVHCNQFSSDESAVFEAVSSQIQVGPVRSPQLTIMHLDDGVDDPLTLNGWIEMARISSKLHDLRWTFSGVTGHRMIEGVFFAPPERFVGINYSDPDGTITHCLNSKIAQGEVRVLHRSGAGWRLKRTLTTGQGAALEIGLKDDLRGVKLHIA